MANKLKNRVVLLIAAGNTLILVLLIAIGIGVTLSMRQLSTITADLYRHPFTANNAMLAAKLEMEYMRGRMQEIVLSRDTKRADRLSVELENLDSSIREKFRTVESSFLGDPGKVKGVYKLLDEWRDARMRTTGLAVQEKWGEAEELVMTSNRIIFTRLNADVDDIVGDTRRRAEAYVRAADSQALLEISRAAWLLAAFAISIFIIGAAMSRRTWLLIHADEQSQETIRRNEQNFRSLFNNMLEGYAQCRMIYENGRPHDFTYLEINDAFEHLTGWKDGIGKNASEVIPWIRETKPDVMEIFGRVALSGTPEQFETYVETLELWFSIAAYSTEKGYFIAIINNITDRKNYERQLRQSASIFQVSSEAMLIVDSRNCISAVNPAFTRISGYGADEVLGKNVGQLSYGRHGQSFYRKMQYSLASTGHWEGEVWDVKKNGDACAVHLIVSAIPADAGIGRPSYTVQFSDITEKKPMEKSLSRHANFDSLPGLANRRQFRDFRNRR